MDELKAFYRNALPPRIQQLEAARAALDSDSAAETAIRRVAHSLRGSGGTYGFPEISASAAAVEQAPRDALRERLDELLSILRATADGSHAG